MPDLSAEFIQAIDELIAAIEGDRSDRNWDRLARQVCRVARLARSLGHNYAPIEFENFICLDGSYANSIVIRPPWGGSYCMTWGEQWRGGEPYVVTTGFIDTALRTLRAWRAQARVRAAQSAGDKPSHSSGKAVSQGDQPDERGYVASPADPAAYAPAADILARHTPADLPITMDRLVAIIEDYDANRVRWTRPLGKKGQPVPNRRSVHLGDWTAYLKRRVPAEADGFPRPTEAEIEDIERRKAAVRRLKRAEK